MVYSTFLYCFIIDQLKSFLSLGSIYCIVVRRFMHLDENETEMLTEGQLKRSPKTENAIPKLKIICLKMLESTPAETVSMLLISIYSVFILFMLTYKELFYLPVDPSRLTEIDSVFLSIFFFDARMSDSFSFNSFRFSFSYLNIYS